MIWGGISFIYGSLLVGPGLIISLATRHRIIGHLLIAIGILQGMIVTIIMNSNPYDWSFIKLVCVGCAILLVAIYTLLFFTTRKR